MLLVDAGDMFQGTLESNMAEGAAVVRAYEALGYHAVAIGNHEFDYGPVGPSAVAGPRDNPQGALMARAAQARFPFLAANLVLAGSDRPWTPPNVRPSHLLRLAGITIGIIGVTTIATPTATLPSNFRGLAVQPLAPAIAREAAALRRRGATVVVVTAHAGASCRRFDPAAPDDLSSCATAGAEIFDVARSIPPGLVDVIVAGHTHAGVAHRVAGVPIIEALEYGRAFGRVDLQIDASGHVRSHQLFAPQTLTARSYEGSPVGQDPAVARVVEPDLAAAADRRNEPLGVMVDAIIRRDYRHESAMGNLFADLMRAARPQADVALLTAGGIRTDLAAGPLLYGSLYEAMPFDNTFAFVKMPAHELGRLVARNLGGSTGIVSLSGVRAEARCRDGRLKVDLVRDDGGAIGDQDPLTVVTSNFLAEGGDGLVGPGRRSVEEAPPLRDAMADVLRRRGGRLSGLDPALLDPARPRVSYPGSRPVRCDGDRPRAVGRPPGAP